MTTETTATSGAGDVVPAATPKSDAEAAQQGSTPAVVEPTAEEKAAAAAKAEADKQEGERKKNRTKDYINRVQSERDELRRRVAELESRSQPQAQQQRPNQPQADTGPTLEQHNYDLAAYQHARDQWVIQQAQKGWSENQKHQAAQQREQETWTAYESKAAEFADEHPDFLEVVGSIEYPLTDAAQAAIAQHPNGPAIAYHLGNNNDDAYELARTPPHLADAAVRRLAARLSAAPPQEAPTPPAPAPTKPLSQTPPPVPTVSGRSPTETPTEKMTDEQWLSRERDKSRKR